MRGNVGVDTKPEVALRSKLHRQGLRFRKNARPVPDLSCRADIVFTSRRVAVFVDGCFWHRCPEHGTEPRTHSSYWSAKLDRNVSRDRENDAQLRAAGWTVVRIWEHDPVEAAASQVWDAVKASRQGHAAMGSADDAAPRRSSSSLILDATAWASSGGTALPS